MPPITLEQALFHRPDGQAPTLILRSAGFESTWIAETLDLIHGFGERRVGTVCPLTVFAQPVGKKHVTVARVMSRDGGLHFHFLVVERKSYDAWIRDPFMLAEKIAPVWDAQDALPAVTIAAESITPRTLAQLQVVLKRIKAAALREGEDPEAPDFERTIENSESPALLGGAQILVDGGRLVFERPEGDLRMVAGLWLLLPEVTRCRLWPTSFAYSQDLEFDVLVVPRVDDVILESYTTEEQAADYPQGTYEYALQHAVEQGTQADLDVVFNRRDSHQTIRLALMLLVLVSCLVLASRWLDFFGPAPEPPNPLTARQQQTAAATAVIGAGEPGITAGVIHYWLLKKDEEKAREQKR